MIFKNLTPHALTVLDADGGEAFFPPEGAPARVTVKTVTRPELAGFRLQAQEFGQVEGLPEPQEGTIYIVSALVLAQCKGRSDVVAPDTGKDAIRENGQIVAVRGFVQ